MPRVVALWYIWAPGLVIYFYLKISVTFLRLCVVVPAPEIAAVLVWSGELLLVFSWLRSCFGVVTSLTAPF